MSRFPDISSLFAALASNLQALDPTAANEFELSISNLNRSLNLSEAPRVQTLDTALSLMCFTAPQVYDSAIQITVRTIVAVLSSSIECKVLRINKDQVFRVGGLISKNDCVNVLEGCAEILRKLDGHKGDLYALLLYNVIRVAALARSFPRAIPSVSCLKLNFSDSNTSALANLVSYSPVEFTLENGKIPLRLLLWQLDPMVLKQDMLQILREIIRRPFLSLRTEIYERREWRSKIICLVISPSMFVETRAFLHNWFLMAGLASIMELQTEFVGQVLDIISRPMWWGISIEIGSKLPFSHAYFPYEHNLMRILAGPISQEYFQLLLCKISGLVFQAGGRKSATKINLVDHKSMWAMVMNFPCWFFFASMMLFSNNKSSPGAAKFIAWILNPMSESNQCLAVKCLVKVSELWSLKCSGSNKHNEVTSIHKECRRRLKLHDKGTVTSHEPDSRAVFLWLKEFQDMYIKISGTKISFPTSNQNLLFRKIPIGILLACPNHLDPAGCSLLLHYAATGTFIQKCLNMQYSGTSQKRWKYSLEGDSVTWMELYTKAEAIAGCKTVFDVTDIAESISHSMFETEEGLDFVCQLKLRAWCYLLKCVERLLQIKLDGDGPQMQRDLLARIIRWRHQGKHVSQNDMDLDRVCDALNVVTASS
ncbi:hypothetical protein PHJA_001409700 [Phtheirospermum japonicum]|uniref:Uncharacterized protein n=1 Tax=Phtheirospermum japonicum TaxID=374723 RepID=A0A830CBT7_9LAMI|nr:hypothetical protein PHJA_001409700 [Phtheirospermum japonicum]